jgi:glycosyltransferase involved in cell wall biosynthesis
LKILLFNPWSPEAGGGLDRWTIEMVRHLASRNEVVLAYLNTTLDEPRRTSLGAATQGSGVHIIQLRGLPAFRLPPFGKPALPTRSGVDFLREWARWADVLCFQQFYLIDALFYLLKVLARKPAVAIWAVPVNHFGRLTVRDRLHNVYVTCAIKLLGNSFDKHIVINKDDKPYFSSLGVQHVEILLPGIDSQVFAPGEPKSNVLPFRVLFVGRLTHQKGIDVLLEAMKKMNSRDLEQMEFTFVGSGREALHVETLARSIKVRVLGFVNDRELITEYQRAHLLVMPSRWESFGLVALEAQACGTPVLASNLQGIREIVTPQTGELVPVEDSAAIARGILQFLKMWKDEPTEFQRMCVDSRANASKFDWDAVAERFAQSLRGCVQG